MDKLQILKDCKEIMNIEAKAIENATKNIDINFVQAVEAILNCSGRVIISGLGKSGIIARKISATLSSLGTPSSFLHPSDALHGDMGVIRKNDLVLMISNSGETEELISLLWFTKNQKNKTIGIIGRQNSTISKNVNISIDAYVEKEACRHNLAPTTSTTVTMALGDALAIIVSELKNFQALDFAMVHPAGSLAKLNFKYVYQVMKRDSLPKCHEDSNILDLISIITKGQLGAALVMKEENLIGIVTDGDIRRYLYKNRNIDAITKDLMTKNPIVISQEVSASTALELMIDKEITVLPVKNKDLLVGAITISDCK